MLLIVAAGLFALNSISTVQGNIEKVASVMSRRLYLVGELRMSAQDAWAGEKGALVSALIKDTKNSESYQDQAKQALKHVVETATELKPLLIIPASQTDLASIQSEVATWQQNTDSVNALMKKGDAKKAQDTSRDLSKPRYRNVVKLASDMEGRILKMMNDTREDAAKQASSLLTIMFCLVIVSMLIGVLAFWMIKDIVKTLRGTVTELSDGGEQVAAASSQIASTSQSLSQGSSEQAASLEEVSASMEEMTAMTRRNSENSSEATSMMAETVSQVDRSNSALQEMVASMGAIKSSSEKVARINKTIDEIAFQTNILALNAAVEAARAGEAGMGFAVVADEVRNLAQRSAVAAKDTAVLIEEAIANSNQGAAKLEQVATAIRAITDSAGKVKGLVDEVNEASKQQTQGINQVSTAVTQVSKVTQTAAASAEESAAAAQELSAQSDTVSDLVQRLRGLVEGAGSRREQHKRGAGSSHVSSTPAMKRFEASSPAAIGEAEDPFPMDTKISGFRNF